MRKLLTALTALTLVGGVSLGAPARTLALVGSGVYWISTASVGAGSSCASPTHQYDATAEGEDQYFNDLLDDILTDVAEQEYASATIAICDADGGAQQVYEMNADTNPESNVEDVEITIAGVQWDATSEADVAGAGDVVIDGMNTFDVEGAAVGGYSPFEFYNADVYIGYLTIRDAFDDNTGAAVHFFEDDPAFIYELNLDHVVIDGAWINEGIGAGVYAVGKVTIEDSTFTNNHAHAGDGGAVYVADAVEVTISGSVFGDPGDDTNGNYSDDDGGDIYVEGDAVVADLKISNSEFYDAEAGDNGGSIAAVCAAAVLNGVTISGSMSYENGGGLWLRDNDCADDYTVTVSNSRFLSTFADDQGGAISDDQDWFTDSLTEVIVKGSYFYQNEAHMGGAINLDGTNLTISKSTFIENQDESGGGVLEFCLNGAVTITGSRFDRNTSNGSGGVIRQNCGLQTLRLVGNTFTQNETEDDGGVVYIEGFSDESTFTATSNKFIGNLAEDSGGVFGVYVNSSAKDSTFLRGLRRNTYRGNRADSDRDGYGKGGILVIYYDDYDGRSTQRRLESALRSGNTLQGARFGLVHQIND
jgi:hypothetical protein